LELSSIRDLALVVLALVVTISSIYLCIMVGIFYKRVSVFLSAMNASALTVKQIADRAQAEVMIPLSQIGAFLQNINRTIAFFGNLFIKKEDKK